MIKRVSFENLNFINFEKMKSIVALTFLALAFLAVSEAAPNNQCGVSFKETQIIVNLMLAEILLQALRFTYKIFSVAGKGVRLDRYPC